MLSQCPCCTDICLQSAVGPTANLPHSVTDLFFHVSVPVASALLAFKCLTRAYRRWQFSSGREREKETEKKTSCWGKSYLNGSTMWVMSG